MRKKDIFLKNVANQNMKIKEITPVQKQKQKFDKQQEHTRHFHIYLKYLLHCQESAYTKEVQNESYRISGWKMLK